MSLDHVLKLTLNRLSNLHLIPNFQIFEILISLDRQVEVAIQLVRIRQQSNALPPTLSTLGSDKGSQDLVLSKANYLP